MTDTPIDEAGTAPEDAAPEADVVPASEEQTAAIEEAMDARPADPPAFPQVALADGDTATAVPMDTPTDGLTVQRHVIHDGVDYHPGDTIPDLEDDEAASLKASGAIAEPDEPADDDDEPAADEAGE